MDKERTTSHTNQQMQHNLFRTNEVATIINDFHNWKVPGPNGVQKFLVKDTDKLTSLINAVLLNLQKMQFLTQGSTNLLPKDLQNTQGPSKFCPITCLPTLYKVSTSNIAKRIYAHSEHNIIATRQKQLNTSCQPGAPRFTSKKPGNTIDTDVIPIRKGIFRKSLWFCIAMNTLPHQLNSTKYNYNIKSNGL